MEAAKEKISNISATAKAGMDRTTATAEEKVEKMKTSDPQRKELAEEMKKEKIRQAELAKHQAYEQNAIHKGENPHTGIGHQTGLGGHNARVGHQTDGVTGLHRTDAPTAGTHTNLTGHGAGGGL